MKLPDLSNSMYVARLRYIQSIHESEGFQNPDCLVQFFIPIHQRWRSTWIRQRDLSKLRADPFYYYLVARTKHYDQVIDRAIVDGVRRIVSVGCGSDTRSFRFGDVLRSKKIRVLECDQVEAIRAKERMVKRWRDSDHVEYLPIDLNDGAWPELGRWIDERREQKTLVLMEGVSPYVDEYSFGRFLSLLASQLSTGSHVSYDFKVRGVNDDFGRAGRTQRPFRLSAGGSEVARFHEMYGLRLGHFESSAALCARLLPRVTEFNFPLFAEDGLVQLQVGQ
jgi:methyltransferase (TIGR00027 family)